MSHPLVSVLIPSRKRPGGLVASVDSLFDTAADPRNVEVLVRLDEDDAESPPAVTELQARHPVTLRVGPRGQGYRDLHLFYSALAARARGQYLMLFNDDAVMLTQGWDVVVNQQPRRACILRPHSAGRSFPLNCFPIFTRDIFEAMGHVSQSPHCDIWLDTLHRRLDLEIPVDIAIQHAMHETSAPVSDETARERDVHNASTLHHFGSHENHLKLKRDTEAVAAILPPKKRLRYLARKPLLWVALARRWYWDYGPYGQVLRRKMERTW